MLHPSQTHPADESSPLGVVRHYRRGGLFGRLLGNRFLLQNRPRAEFEIHRQLEAAGLPVPPLLGVMWERQGLWYRGAIATEYVPWPTLQSALRAPDADADTLLRACGRVSRQLHDLGVSHPDLQVRNLLVDGDRAALLDFDKARHHAVLTDGQRAHNVLRFRRSLERNGFPASHFEAFLSGYGDIALPWLLSTLYRMRGRFSDSFRDRNPT